MNIKPENMLSKEFLDTLTKHGFQINVYSLYDGALLVAGPVVFEFSHAVLPEIPDCNDPLGKATRPIRFFETADGCAPRVEINMTNRNRPNFDREIAKQVYDNSRSLDVSTLTMLYLDHRGHGMHGMPLDMKGCYEFVEKVVKKAKDLAYDLKSKFLGK